MNQQTVVPLAAAWPAGRRQRGRLPTGTDYMIGREPTLDAAAAGKARPPRVDDDSGTASRVHVRIELDGWQVLVAELGSANGSRPQLLDQACEQQLTTCMPVLLLSDSHGDMEPGSAMSPAAAAEADEPVLALGSGAR
jgi:hypothetical protein